MRPWAKWMINHNLRWLLYGLCALMLPVYLAALSREAWNEMRSEMRGIAMEPKDKERAP